jgi:3-deoxy-D-manno-octulosonic-acid transferase
LKWQNRLGFFTNLEKKEDSITIWLHASSVGEVKVANILKNQLLKIESSLTIIITVMTDAGYQTGTQIADSANRIGFIPMDYSAPIKRFIKCVKPDAAVFIETEIWPNLICELPRFSIPMFLANGRLSQRSVRRYRRIKGTLKKLLAEYTYIMVQSEAEYNRFIEIGAAKDKLKIIGSLKFDAPPEIIDEVEKSRMRNLLPFANNAPVLTAGSTRKGEEDILLRVFTQLRQKIRNLVLIIAPRHLNRIPDIRKMLSDSNHRYVAHTEIDNSEINYDIVLIDKIGILGSLYSISDIAFVGGTLVDIGGHNILEPVWAGIPVLFGPSIANVRDSAKYIIGNRLGAMVEDEKTLLLALTDFFENKSEFRRKSADSDEAPLARKTAQLILSRIIFDGENLANHNK